jgi:hypothetical protein
MSPDLLEQELGKVMGGFSPVELGKQLRNDYEQCVQGFWDIVKATGELRGAHDGSHRTPAINLGIFNHPNVGAAKCSATVKVQPKIVLSSGRTENHIPYGVEVKFYGSTEDGRQQVLATELFGGGGYNFIGMRAPAFIRDPGCKLDMPWIGEADHYSGGFSDEYPWDEDNLIEVQNRLCPMIETARRTQAMLVRAMQDPELNPKFHVAASGLYVPS